MQIKMGSSRLVVIFKNFVIKIPKFWRISRFALGVVENLTERYWYCADNTVKTMDINKYPLAPILYASSNGLIMVMQRADVVATASGEVESGGLSRDRGGEPRAGSLLCVCWVEPYWCVHRMVLEFVPHSEEACQTRLG